MKRPSKFDGETALPGSVAASPLGPPQGEAIIPFPHSVAAALTAEGSEGAGVSSASASSFGSIGAVTHAVVLRLRGGFPKIRGPARQGGAEPRRSLNQREGEDR